jgi:D-alanyl-D-alanine carboxypeptidase
MFRLTYKNGFISILSVLLCLFVLPQVQAASDDDRISALLDTLVARDEIPGVAVIVNHGGKADEYYAGLADNDDASALMRAQNGFQIGSVSKLYTAVLILNAIDAGKFALDDKIKDFTAASFEGGNIANFKDITFRHVFESTTGLADIHGTSLLQDVFLNNKCLIDENDVAAYAYDLPAQHKAGQGFGYGSLPYVLLGSVLKNIYMEADLDKIYTAQLFEPLALAETSFYKENLPQMNYGVERYNAMFPVTNASKIWTGCMRSSAGGLVATARDLDKFLSALFREKTALSSAMLTYAMSMTPPPHQTGHGVEIWQSDFGAAYGHKGRFPGFMVAGYYFPEHDTTISVLSNSGLIEMENVLDVLAAIEFSDKDGVVENLTFVKNSYQEEVKLYDQLLALPNMNVPSLKPQKNAGE